MELEKEWNQLVVDSGGSIEAAKPAYDELCNAYCEKHRYYHTLEHLAQMLSLLSEAGINKPASLWATWYHDYVYNPGKKDNEAKSAIKARETLSGLGITSEVIDEIEVIILATKDHALGPKLDDTALAVLDADMSILGVPKTQYEEYVRSVRKEFHRIPKFLYNRGRKGFLNQTLSTDKIFATNWFFERFENQARQNIVTELSQL